MASLDFRHLSLSSLDGMDIMPFLSKLDLSNNVLSNFYGMPTHPNLSELCINDNRITSFLGMSHQPNLEVLTMLRNPICAHPFFRIMALLACGEHLSVINQTPVSQEERLTCANLGGSGGWAAQCISYGWIGLNESSQDFHDIFENSYLKEAYVTVVERLDPISSFAAVVERIDQSRVEEKPDHLPVEARRSEVHPPNLFSTNTSNTVITKCRPLNRTVYDNFYTRNRPGLKSIERILKTNSVEQRKHHPNSAVESARHYAHHLQTTGTVTGANIYRQPDCAHHEEREEATQFIQTAQTTVKKKRPTEASILPGVQGAAALLLMQSEVGSICGIAFDSVDVIRVKKGVDAAYHCCVCRISASGAMCISHHDAELFSIELVTANDISLDLKNAAITISKVKITGSEEGPKETCILKVTGSRREERSCKSFGRLVFFLVDY